MNVEAVACELAHVTMKACARQIELRIQSCIPQILVPSRHRSFAILHVLAAQDFVERVAKRNFARHKLSIFDDHQGECSFGCYVLLILLLFFEASLQSCCKEVRAVRAYLAAE